VLKIFDDPSVVGREISSYLDLFKEVDNIDVTQKRSGNKRVYVYKRTVTTVTTVTCTQQSLNL